MPQIFLVLLVNLSRPYATPTNAVNKSCLDHASEHLDTLSYMYV